MPASTRSSCTTSGRRQDLDRRHGPTPVRGAERCRVHGHARGRGRHRVRGVRADQGRLPVVGRHRERAQLPEEGVGQVGGVEEVPGDRRDRVLPLLPERGVVGAAGVEADVGRARGEDRRIRPGQLRGCAHEVLPGPEEDSVPGRAVAQERVHRHVEAHLRGNVRRRGSDRDVLPWSRT